MVVSAIFEAVSPLRQLSLSFLLAFAISVKTVTLLVFPHPFPPKIQFSESSKIKSIWKFCYTDWEEGGGRGGAVVARTEVQIKRDMIGKYKIG